MFFIAYAFKGQVHGFAGHCKSLVQHDKCNIEMFLSSVYNVLYAALWKIPLLLKGLIVFGQPCCIQNALNNDSETLFKETISTLD